MWYPFWQIFSESNGNHLAEAMLESSRARRAVYTYLLIFPSFKLCHLDQLDDDIRISSTSEWDNVLRQIHDIGLKVHNQLS